MPKKNRGKKNANPQKAKSVTPTTQSIGAGDAPVLDHRFNDDLLMGMGDQQLARTTYPELFHVLDFPELREQFQKYNKQADKAKAKVHLIGLLAVMLATLALGSSAMAPILDAILHLDGLNDRTVKTLKFIQNLSIGFEVLGLIGSAIAIGGIGIADWKAKWLQCRLMAERLRQWHFQLMIHKGSEIESSCDPTKLQAKQHFVSERNKWFLAFVHLHEGCLDSQLHELVESPESKYISLHDGESQYSANSPIVLKVFEAYRVLRLKHQALYAAHKLQKKTSIPLWKPHRWPLPVLQSRLSTVTSSCLIGALCVSAVILVSHFFDWPIAHTAALPAVILCLLVLTAAIRAVQDGLAVREEVQRYVDYDGEVRYLLTKFEGSNDQAEKLRFMHDMERAVVDELKDFLRAHSESKFIV